MNVTIDPEKCTCCWKCMHKCSGGCFSCDTHGFLCEEVGNIKFDGTNCIDCMACTEPDFCPNNAVEVEVVK